LYAPDRFGWIEAVAAVAASGDPEHAFALVVPQRIGADARQAREFRRAENRTPFEGDRHLARSRS
jgi:hypothetical protein